MRQETDYDVVIVGSGAGGGMAAYVLTKAGVRVLMLEAGRDYDPLTETPMLHRPDEAPLLGTGTPDKEFGYYDATVHGGWQIEGEPYAKAPGTQFNWWRSRMLGGRTNHWARICFRLGPYDFKPKSRDGLGVDWPVSYADVHPYYDRLERLIGVYGSNHGLENHPSSGDGVLHSPPAMRVPELFIKAGAASMGIPVVAAHRAILTRQIDERSPCFWASSCGRGCSIGAAFQSTTSLLPWARATGNLDIVTDAMVYEVEMGPDGNARGVHYIDKRTGAHKFVKTRILALAASTGETARILLNSTGRSPAGVANSSGQVGRNLVDTVGSAVSAHFPALEGRPRYNEDGAMGLHAYIPFWLYKEQAAGQLDFPRGYHYEFGHGFGEPGMGAGGAAWYIDGYGQSMKEEARRYYGAQITFVQRGEMIPNENCYAEVDPDLKDRYGIPVLRFHYAHSDHEYNQVAHFQDTSYALIDRLGGKPMTPRRDPREAIDPGGHIIHEVGTARMGSDPESSVVTEHGQAHDVKNLFLMDGSIFASKAHKNPTLTIMALAWRNADHMIAEMKRGTI